MYKMIVCTQLNGDKGLFALVDRVNYNSDKIEQIVLNDGNYIVLIRTTVYNMNHYNDFYSKWYKYEI